MTGGDDQRRADARQGRVAAVVIALSGVLAVIAPWLSQKLGLTIRHEMLFYLISLAGFAWALVVTFQIWRRRRQN